VPVRTLTVISWPEAIVPVWTQTVFCMNYVVFMYTSYIIDVGEGLCQKSALRWSRVLCQKLAYVSEFIPLYSCFVLLYDAEGTLIEHYSDMMSVRTPLSDPCGRYCSYACLLACFAACLLARFASRLPHIASTPRRRCSPASLLACCACVCVWCVFLCRPSAVNPTNAAEVARIPLYIKAAKSKTTTPGAAAALKIISGYSGATIVEGNYYTHRFQKYQPNTEPPHRPSAVSPTEGKVDSMLGPRVLIMNSPPPCLRPGGKS
jgi:hypothetical protein